MILATPESPPGFAQFESGYVSVVPVLRVAEAMREDTAAIDSFPPVEIIGERVPLVPSQFMGKKIGNAGRLQQLRQVAVESKRVRQPCYPGTPFEFGLEVPLTVQQLANPGFSGRQITVGFNPHASDDVPSALPDESLYFFEKRGIILFNPGVNLSA